MKGNYKTAAVALAVAIAVLIAVIPVYTELHTPEMIRKGPGVTSIKHLSDYFEGLKGSPGDTVFFKIGQGTGDCLNCRLYCLHPYGK